MTLVELSSRVGVTVANLSILKNSHAKAIRFSTLTAICDALGCTPRRPAQPARLTRHRRRATAGFIRRSGSWIQMPRTPPGAKTHFEPSGPRDRCPPRLAARALGLGVGVALARLGLDRRRDCSASGCGAAGPDGRNLAPGPERTFPKLGVIKSAYGGGVGLVASAEPPVWSPTSAARSATTTSPVSSTAARPKLLGHRQPRLARARGVTARSSRLPLSLRKREHGQVEQGDADQWWAEIRVEWDFRPVMDDLDRCGRCGLVVPSTPAELLAHLDWHAARDRHPSSGPSGGALHRKKRWLSDE